jgi:hypothetical protein
VRSPEDVVEEMAWLKRTYAPDHVAFADDMWRGVSTAPVCCTRERAGEGSFGSSMAR